MGLGRNSRQIFGFKRLICKIFRNKDLAPQIALKMALGQLRGSSSSTDKPLNCPNSGNIIALSGLGVCDGAHWLFVMKKSRRPGATVEFQVLKSAKPFDKLGAGSGAADTVESKQLDWRGVTGCRREPAVARNQSSAECFGKHDVGCIICGQIVTQLPNPGQQNEVRIPSDSQVQQVLDCLIGAVG